MTSCRQPFVADSDENMDSDTSTEDRAPEFFPNSPGLLDWVGSVAPDDSVRPLSGAESASVRQHPDWSAFLGALAGRPLPVVLILADPPPQEAGVFLEWFAQRGVVVGITSEVARKLQPAPDWMTGIRLLLTDGQPVRIAQLAPATRLAWLGPGPTPIVPMGCHEESITEVSEVLRPQQQYLRAQNAAEQIHQQQLEEGSGESRSSGRGARFALGQGWRDRLFRTGLSWAQKPIVGPVLRWGWALSQSTRTYHAALRLQTQVEQMQAVHAEMERALRQLHFPYGRLSECLRWPAPDQLATARASLHAQGGSSVPADFTDSDVRQLWLGELGGTAGRDVLRRQYDSYRPFLLPLDGPLLDVGCGRGDWLAYLAEQGENDAIGIDSNASTVERCRSRGLHAEQADAFDWLSRHTGEYAAITLMQVIEHIPRSRLAEMLAALAAALRPGGMLLLETVNPAHPLALSMFYNDPTHERPLPTEFLGFLGQCAGLSPQDTLYTYPLEVTVTAAQWQNLHYVNYALLFRKP